MIGDAVLCQAAGLIRTRVRFSPIPVIWTSTTWCLWQKLIVVVRTRGLPSNGRTMPTDLFHTDGLIAVSASANRSKGDIDPARWLPPNQSYHCEYVRKWVLIKATWWLDMDADERETVQTVLAGCR